MLDLVRFSLAKCMKSHDNVNAGKLSEEQSLIHKTLLPRILLPWDSSQLVCVS